MKSKLSAKEIWLDYVPMFVCAALILFFAILKEQTVIKTLPTLITLVVQLLLVRANRFAFLLGAANSLIYGVAYWTEDLYFSMISTVLISAPIQIYSFFHWRAHSGGLHTRLRLLPLPRLLIILLLTLGGWLMLYFSCKSLFATAAYPLWDSLLFVLGITISLLVARRAVESQYINLISCVISIVIWILLTVRTPGDINYVIISFYNLFRVAQAAVSWTRQYLRDKSTDAATSTAK